ncbi:hypothetical protein O7627_23365 [Solwaraspora sp. WMMD1047]|uniref:hypothetical protein n=1 Tax=Solwaraspora sp. WMMD1047 TaxID=3016102 RepID=UPI002416EBAC|nr:hypothetical protein [Solwaraspora sp. WMMD1047]MDG4832226.1 hypothetical protein [Solwaraspora sp. WMMD1047]
MAGTDPGSAREEAERLVATVLAAARLAAAGKDASGLAAAGQQAARAAGLGPLGDLISGAFGGGIATGTPECCVCPVCRGIAALRDPDPQFAERLAAGAGEVAAGVATVLRAFGEATRDRSPADPAPAGTDRDPADPGSADPGPADPGPADPGPADPGPADPGPADPGPVEPRGGSVRDDQVWREATRTGHDSWPAPERDVWAAATRAEARTTDAGAAPPVDVAGPGGPSRPADRRSTGPAAVPTGTADAEGAGRPAVPASRAPESAAATDGVPPADGD